MSKNLVFFLIDAGLLVVCVAGSIYFHLDVLILVWVAFTVAFGIYWRARTQSAPRSAPGDGAPEPALRLANPRPAALAAGALFSALVALFAAAIANRGQDVALLGVPYLVPLGPAALGNAGARGPSLGAFLFGGDEPTRAQTLAFAALTLVLIYVFQFLFSDYASVSDFLSAYLSPVSHGLPRSAQSGPAPWPPLTPWVQLAGVLAGAFVLTLKNSQPSP